MALDYPRFSTSRVFRRYLPTIDSCRALCEVSAKDLRGPEDLDHLPAEEVNDDHPNPFIRQEVPALSM